MSEQSPAFQFYPRDFLSDERVRIMSVDEVGVYWLLICSCWLEGSIPDDVEQLARMMPRMTTREMNRHWKIVSRCFIPHPTEHGRLIQKRVEKERKTQAQRREKAAEAGRSGAGKRWGTHSDPIATLSPPYSDPIAIALPIEHSSSSSSSSSSSAKDDKTKVLSETDRLGFEMRDALGHLIRPHLTGMTYSAWRSINSKFAKDMVAAGLTVEQAVAFWQSEYDRTGHPIIKLVTLQERLSSQGGGAVGTSDNPRPDPTEHGGKSDPELWGLP